MNTMTIDDVIKEAESRAAAIEISSAEFKNKEQVTIIRQWDVPYGVRSRGIIYFRHKDGTRAFSIKYIQYKKLIDVSEYFITSGPYRDWSDFFNCMYEKYTGLRDDEIVALIHIDKEIML